MANVARRTSVDKYQSVRQTRKGLRPVEVSAHTKRAPTKKEAAAIPRGADIAALAASQLADTQPDTGRSREEVLADLDDSFWDWDEGGYEFPNIQRDYASMEDLSAGTVHYLSEDYDCEALNKALREGDPVPREHEKMYSDVRADCVHLRNAETAWRSIDADFADDELPDVGDLEIGDTFTGDGLLSAAPSLPAAADYGNNGYNGGFSKIQTLIKIQVGTHTLGILTRGVSGYYEYIFQDGQQFEVLDIHRDLEVVRHAYEDLSRHKQEIGTYIELAITPPNDDDY